MDQRYARVLLDNPVGHTEYGAMFVLPASLEWQQVEWLDPWECDHVETMCAQCVHSWARDHEVELPEGIEIDDEDDDDRDAWA